jgi:hypothetical protein
VETCSLQLESSNAEVYTGSGVLPPGTPDGLNRTGIMGAGDFLPRFLLEGLPVGEFRYVKHLLFLNVQEVAREAEQVLKVLQREGGPSGSCKVPQTCPSKRWMG